MRARTQADLHARHDRLLESLRAASPDSAHPHYGLDELEALKAENDRLVARDMAERPDVCASYPSYMTIGNTHKCNLTCNMCFKQLDDVRNMSLPDMGYGRFESLAHELFPHIRRIALSVSGEPLISRTLFKELDLIASYGVRANVTTNGMPLAKKGLFEKLVPALNTLIVSMDGASPPVFNCIRRGADFERVVKHIRLFNEYRNALPLDSFRPLLHFNNILQRLNVLELPALVELACDLEVDFMSVDHVYIHEGLNEADSLERHKRLTNESLAKAAETASRRGIEVRLPEPYRVDEGEPDTPYELPDREDLLRRGKVVPEAVDYEAALHEGLERDAIHEALETVRRNGGGNGELVEALLDIRMLYGHLGWGVPQLGPSLIPSGCEKVSSCAYPWRESFVEYNGLVAPCCNPAMGAGRVMGRYESGDTFRDIWNGPVYQQLRRSLSSGQSYRFCRYCYLVEDPNEAAWGTGEAWVKVGTQLDGDGPAVAGTVPEDKRFVLIEVRSDTVPAGSVLEIRANERLLLEIAADSERSADGARFDRAIEGGLKVESGAVVRLRCPGSSGLKVDLIGYVE